jgi:hypothetical protein
MLNKFFEMEVQFDKNKNLQDDLILTCTELKQLFGYNAERKKKIENLFIVADKFKKIGCEIMFVFGSFATAEEYPNDIDVCFDMSNISMAVLEKNNSSIDKYELARIKHYLMVHVILKRVNEERLIEFFKHDRNGNERGIIEVDLKDLKHDKE